MKNLECHIEEIDSGEEHPHYFVCIDEDHLRDFDFTVYLYDEVEGLYLVGFFKKLLDDLTKKMFVIEEDPLTSVADSYNRYEVKTVQTCLSNIKERYNQV